MVLLCTWPIWTIGKIEGPLKKGFWAPWMMMRAEEEEEEEERNLFPS